LIDHVLTLLDKPKIKSDPQINTLLSAKITQLLKLDAEKPLSPEYIAFYNCVAKLLDQEGNIRVIIKQQLLQLESAAKTQSEHEAKSVSSQPGPKGSLRIREIITHTLLLTFNFSMV
jgi:hypothetical protein